MQRLVCAQNLLRPAATRQTSSRLVAIVRVSVCSNTMLTVVRTVHSCGRQLVCCRWAVRGPQAVPAAAGMCILSIVVW